jgi:hypothetical protein
MSDQASFSVVASLKQKIASETDPVALVALYEQLVPMLREPSKRKADMTYAEKVADRERRKEARANGINLRTGLPWTAEERAKQAELSAKLKGRTMTPEAKAKIAAANEKRHNQKLAMEQRLAELEAIVAGKNVTEAAGNEHRQGGKRR